MTETDEVIPAQPVLSGEVLESEHDPMFDEYEGAGMAMIQRLRLGMIRDITKNGTVKVTDLGTSDRVFLNNLMTGYDISSTTKARLRIAAKTEKGLSDLTSAVGEALMKFRVEKPAAPASKRVLPEDIKPTNVVPGHMERGNIPVDFDSFMKSDPANS